MDGTTALGLGLLLGARHAADPDHVAAIAQLVTQDRPRRAFGEELPSAIRTAAAWGIGHSLTLLAVGGGLVASGLVLPARFETAATVAVAATLLALAVLPRATQPSAARPLVVGVVHGLAGSAAVTLLALATMPSRAWAFAYLVATCTGTVLAMVLGTSLLAAGLLQSPRTLARGFSLAARVAAVAVAMTLIASLLTESP